MKNFKLKSNQSLISKENIAQKEKSFLLQHTTNSVKILRSKPSTFSEQVRVRHHDVDNGKLVAVKNLEKKNQVKKIKLSSVGIRLRSFSGWSKFFKYQVNIELKKIEKKRGEKELESTSAKGEKAFKNKSLNSQYQEQTKKEIFFRLLNVYITDRETKKKKNNFYKKSVMFKADQSLTKNINLNSYLQNMYYINDKLFLTKSLASTCTSLVFSGKKNYLKRSSFLTFFFIKNIFLIHFYKKSFFFFFIKSLKNMIKNVIFSLWCAQLFSKQFNLKKETQCFIEERYAFSKFFFVSFVSCKLSGVRLLTKQLNSKEFCLLAGVEKTSLFFQNNLLKISFFYSLLTNKKREEKKYFNFFSFIFSEKIKMSKLFFYLLLQNSGKIFSFLKNVEKGYLNRTGNFVRFCSVVRLKDFSNTQIKIIKNDFGSFLTVKRILYFLKKNSSTYFFSSVFFKNFLGVVGFKDASVFSKRKRTITSLNQKIKAFVWKRGTFHIRKYIQLRKTNKKKKHFFWGIYKQNVLFHYLYFIF